MAALAELYPIENNQGKLYYVTDFPENLHVLIVDTDSLSALYNFNSLSPSMAFAGTGAFTTEIFGENMTSGSTAMWNGAYKNTAGIFTQALTYKLNSCILQNSLYWLQNGSSYQSNYIYTYDCLNRLTKTAYPANNQIEKYEYDDDGNITCKENAQKKMDYAYITGLNKINYISVLNKQTNVTANYSYGYDVKGNVISDQRKSIQAIEYSWRNLPLQITSANGTVKYRYNDNGNRIYREYGSGSNLVKEYFLLDQTGRELAVKRLYEIGIDTVASYNIYGLNDKIGRLDVTWTKQFTGGKGGIVDPDPPGYTIIRTDAPYYYITDCLGSVRATLDVSANMVFREDTYPYGEIKESFSLGGTGQQRFDFTGKERDAETGLSYFGARYYDSETCRWYSPDPMADKYPGWSPYNYCMNNPVNKFDPNGLWSSSFLSPDHQRITYKALRGIFKERELKVLMNAQCDADSKEYQDVASSHRHGMLEPGQSIPDFVAKMNTFLMDGYNDFNESWSTRGKMGALGSAIHSVQDFLCPAHQGHEWDGNDGWYVPNNWVHTVKEIYQSEENRKYMRAAVAATRYLAKNWIEGKPVPVFCIRDVDSSEVGEFVTYYKKKGFLVIVDGVVQ